MKRLRSFIGATVVGGILVVLPAGLMLFLGQWVFGLLAGALQPLTDLLAGALDLRQKTVASCLTIAIMLAACFAVGLVVRTRGGRWLLGAIEGPTLKRLWGYTMIKETVAQLLGGRKSPFTTVAVVQIYGNETLVSAFVTDTHADGSCTVFVPTGPNPTSGNIYHLPGRYVHPVDVPVEVAMRSIISCGAGSGRLIEAHRAGGANGQAPPSLPRA